jgi:hypothetical protein
MPCLRSPNLRMKGRQFSPEALARWLPALAVEPGKAEAARDAILPPAHCKVALANGQRGIGRNIAAEVWLLLDFAGKRTAFPNQFRSHVSTSNRPSAIVLDNAGWYRRGAPLLQQYGYVSYRSMVSSLGSLGSCARVCSPNERVFRPRRKRPAFSRRFLARNAQLTGRALRRSALTTGSRRRIPPPRAASAGVS